MGLQSTGGPAVAAQLVRSDRPTYVVPFSLNPTAAVDLVSVQAGPGKVARLSRIVITNPGLQTGAAVVTLQVGTITGLGSGGATPTPGNVDPVNDLAATSTAHTGDTTVGGGITNLHQVAVYVPAAAGAFTPVDLLFGADGFRKAPTVAASATAKGFTVRHPGAAGAAGFAGFIEFTEEPN